MSEETVVQTQEQIEETIVSQSNGQEAATNGANGETHTNGTNGHTEAKNRAQNGHSETNGKTENGHTENGHANGTTQELVPEYFRKVFIGSLSYSTTDDAFQTYFSQYGTILDCVIMKETKTNKSRGFGFVTYDKQACVDELMKGRPHKLDNRELEIKRATPREDSGKPGAESTTTKVT
jgi:RNA recognition motif-containing protein